MHTHVHIHNQWDVQQHSQQFACVRGPFWGWVWVETLFGWVGWMVETLIMRMLISSDDERNWTLCAAEDSHSHNRPLSLPSSYCTHTHTYSPNTETHSHTDREAFMVTLWNGGALANNPQTHLFLGQNGFIENVVCFSIWVCFAAFSASFFASPYSIFLHYKIYIVWVWVCVSQCLYVCVWELLLLHAIQNPSAPTPLVFPPNPTIVLCKFLAFV